MGERRPKPSPWLARSLVRTGARRRLEAELRALASDVLGRPQPGELPTDCAEWVAATIDAAVSHVCDTSLDDLAQTLEEQLEAAPSAYLRRLQEAAIRHDAGY